MNSTIKSLIYSVVLFVVSCTQPSDMLTVIAPDGSCYREFTENVNPKFLLGDTASNLNPFPVIINSSWKISWKYKNSKINSTFPIQKTLYDSIQKNINQTLEIKKQTSNRDGISQDLIVYAWRNYKSADDMDTLFKLKRTHPWSNFKVKHLLSIKFRWFYTYYSYKEIYPKVKNNFVIPIEKFMTKDEAMFWFTGKPDILKGLNGVEIREYVGNIEDNFRKWFNKNLWDLEYKILLENYEKIDQLKVSKNRLTLIKDTIFNVKVNNAENFNMDKILDNYFKTTSFSKFWKSENCPMVKFEQDFNNQKSFLFFGGAFNYKLILPGKIIQSNDAVLHGDTMNWKLTAYRMIPADYVIEAESRKINIWAFILSGFILILAIGSFIWKPGKR